MKIPIEYVRALGDIRPMVFLSFSGSHGLHLHTKAIVDTGCPNVIITEPNLQRTRIPLTALNYTRDLLLGSIKLKIASLGTCTLNFIDSEGEYVNFEHEVYVGKPDMQVNTFFVNGLQNCIGLDFLKANKLAVIPEDCDGKAYLEKREKRA